MQLLQQQLVLGIVSTSIGGISKSHARESRTQLEWDPGGHPKLGSSAHGRPDPAGPPSPSKPPLSPPASAGIPLGTTVPKGWAQGPPTLHLSILQVPPTAPSSAQPKHRSAVCGFSEDALSSQKPCIPQRASSPSAGTSWIWYSEVWSIWTQTWCDLQGGKGDIT